MFKFIQIHFTIATSKRSFVAARLKTSPSYELYRFLRVKFTRKNLIQAMYTRPAGPSLDKKTILLHHRLGANPFPRKKLCLGPWHEARALSRELPFTAVGRQLTPTLTAEILPPGSLSLILLSRFRHSGWNMTRGGKGGWS